MSPRLVVSRHGHHPGFFFFPASLSNMGIEPISQWSRRLPLDVPDFRDERGCRVQKVPDQTRQVAETNRLPAGRQQPPTPEPSLSQKQRNNKYRGRCNVSFYSEDRTENNICLLFHTGFHSHAQPLARPLAPPEAARPERTALFSAIPRFKGPLDPGQAHVDVGPRWRWRPRYAASTTAL